MLGARRCRDRSRRPSRPAASLGDSQLFSQEISHYVHVHGLTRDDVLEPGVFGFKFLEPLELGLIHAAVLAPPAMNSRLRNAELPRDRRDALAAFHILQHVDDLFF
jgi:hypothetical protein